MSMVSSNHDQQAGTRHGDDRSKEYGRPQGNGPRDLQRLFWSIPFKPLSQGFSLVGAEPVRAGLVQSLQDAGWSRARIAQHREAIVKCMMKSGLSIQDADRALWHLLNHPQYPATEGIATGDYPKTDPVRESIEVIKDID